MRLVKWVLKSIILLFILAVSFSIFANVWIVQHTKTRVFPDMDFMPPKEVTLVLGTSKQLVGGRANPFFENRMDAAAALYHNGKTRQFLLSGSNPDQYYNEPKDMKKALVKRGVPEEAISLDFAGLRTFDSVYRAREIFGQNEFIIVTQAWHAYRALFICDFYDMDAVAYTAANVSVYESTHVTLREFLARPKAIIDLYILRKQATVMGNKEELNKP